MMKIMPIYFNPKLYRYYLYFLKLKDTLQDQRQQNSACFQKIKEDFYEKLWTDTAKQLGAEIQASGYGYYKIQLGENTTYVHNSLVMLDNYVTLRIAGNKPLINSILSENHYPTVNHVEYDLNNIKKAYNFIKHINKPCVVKPAQSGAAGKGITTGINSWYSLTRASLGAAIYGDKLILEEQMDGNSYRLLYLNGQYLDAVKRNPPRIIGDGKNIIKRLIVNENFKRTNSDKIISLFPLTIDSELKSFLNSQQRHLNDILPQNKSIPVKRVVNQNSRNENESVKAIVHPEIIEMGAQIAKLLKVQLAGVDVISKDISKPLKETNGVINEINTTPGLHHHYLISDESKITPVAFYIMKYLLNSH